MKLGDIWTVGEKRERERTVEPSMLDSVLLNTTMKVTGHLEASSNVDKNRTHPICPSG